MICFSLRIEEFYDDVILEHETVADDEDQYDDDDDSNGKLGIVCYFILSDAMFVDWKQLFSQKLIEIKRCQKIY